MLSWDYSIEFVGCIYSFLLCRGARFGIPKAKSSLNPWELDPEPKKQKLAEWDYPLISGGFRVQGLGFIRCIGLVGFIAFRVSHYEVTFWDMWNFVFEKGDRRAAMYPGTQKRGPPECNSTLYTCVQIRFMAQPPPQRPSTYEL